jgi:HAD superfamily phosphoserine phosphatase-like hydrolase
VVGLLVASVLPTRAQARAPKLQQRTACQLTGPINEQLKLPFAANSSPLGRWMLRSIDPKTCRALNRLIASNKRGPATFDADGTLWKDDVGEGFFTWMMKHRYYPADKIPTLEQAWRGYKAGTFDDTKMYELMVTSMAGMKETDVARLARRYFDSEHKHSIYQPMAALVSALGETGFQPWVVSGSPYWVVAAGARHFGIPTGRVIGLRVRVDREGRLTDEIVRPVPWKEGKAQSILAQIGQPPVIAAGDSRGDREMLKIASALPLAINPQPDLIPYTGRMYVNKLSRADTLARWAGRTTMPALPAPQAPAGLLPAPSPIPGADALTSSTTSR